MKVFFATRAFSLAKRAGPDAQVNYRDAIYLSAAYVTGSTESSVAAFRE